MKTRHALFGGLAVMALLAACTRSATTATVPTETSVAPQAVDATPASDPTMDLLSTQVAGLMTATAGAPAGGEPGAGAVATPSPTALAPTAAPVTSTVATATAIPVGATAAPVAACASPYTVKQGDWIYKIARDCKLDPKAIVAANPTINPNRLSPGQQIVLPGAAAVTPAPGASATPAPAQPACTGSYTVKTGDNLFRIAFNCGLTTEQMARANNIQPPYRIFPGQVLKYP